MSDEELDPAQRRNAENIESHDRQYAEFVRRERRGGRSPESASARG